MRKPYFYAFLAMLCMLGCEQGPSPRAPDGNLGKKYREAFKNLAADFERQIATDAQNASAHAGLAEMYATLWCFGYSSRSEVLPKARDAAMTAVALDDENANAQTALGIVNLCDWDWAGAEQALSRAVQLDPKDANAHHWYALYLAAMGRHSQAMTETNLAGDIEPDSLGYRTGKGAVLYFGRDFEEMREQMIVTSSLDPEFPWAYDWLGMAYVQLRNFERAIDVYNKAVQLSDGTAEVLAGLGHAHGVAGNVAEAEKILDELEQHAKIRHVPPVQRAYVCISLEKTDRAFELLEEAYAEHSWELVFLRVEPWFDPIREDARFINLVKRMQLPDKPNQ